MSCCAAFGPNDSYFFKSPTKCSMHGEPDRIRSLYTTERESPRDVHEVALGPDGSFVIIYTLEEQGIKLRHKNLPLELKNWLLHSTGKMMSAERDLPTMQISLGPNESYMAFDKNGASWSNLPPGLNTAMKERQDSNGSFRPWTFPTNVTLGANGTYVLIDAGGVASWDLGGHCDDLNRVLSTTNMLHGMIVILSPFYLNHYIVVTTSGESSGNYPSQCAIAYKAFKEDIKSAVRAAYAQQTREVNGEPARPAQAMQSPLTPSSTISSPSLIPVSPTSSQGYAPQTPEFNSGPAMQAQAMQSPQTMQRPLTPVHAMCSPVISSPAMLPVSPMSSWDSAPQTREVDAGPAMQAQAMQSPQTMQSPPPPAHAMSSLTISSSGMLPVRPTSSRGYASQTREADAGTAMPAQATQSPPTPAHTMQPPPMPAYAMQPPPMPAQAMQPPPMPVQAMQPPPMPAHSMSSPSMPAQAMQSPPMPAQAMQPPPMPQHAMSSPTIPSSGMPPVSPTSSRGSVGSKSQTESLKKGFGAGAKWLRADDGKNALKAGKVALKGVNLFAKVANATGVGPSIPTFGGGGS